MSQRVKIAIEVPQSIVGPTVETLWAERTKGGYKLLNSPLYAKGISHLDVVEASGSQDGLLKFTKKVGTAGHSTYRLLIEGNSDWMPYWEEIQSLGCTYEESIENCFRLLSVDVPPTCNIYTAYALMERGESAGVWQFEEADVNHALNRAS